MAKEKDISPREAAWEDFKAAHEKQNPAKHAARAAAGELNKIPDSFRPDLA